MFFLINFVSLLAKMINLCLLPCCRFVLRLASGHKHLILFMKITNACHGRGKFIVFGQRRIPCGDTSSGFLELNDTTWCFKRLLRFTLAEKCLFLQFTSRPSHYRRASIRKNNFFALLRSRLAPVTPFALTSSSPIQNSISCRLGFFGLIDWYLIWRKLPERSNYIKLNTDVCLKRRFPCYPGQVGRKKEN